MVFILKRGKKGHTLREASTGQEAACKPRGRCLKLFNLMSAWADKGSFLLTDFLWFFECFPAWADEWKGEGITCLGFQSAYDKAPC